MNGVNTQGVMHISTDRGYVLDSLIDNKIVSLEIHDFLLGDYLGCGSTRYIFAYKLDPKLVVKIDVSDCHANAMEYKVWEQIQYVPKLAKWFAPVSNLSRCGRIMLQRRCKTNLAQSSYPKKVPSFMFDRKFQNWGELNKNMVCFDYANIGLLDLGNYKMVNSEFWDVEKFRR